MPKRKSNRAHVESKPKSSEPWSALVAPIERELLEGDHPEGVADALMLALHAIDACRRLDDDRDEASALRATDLRRVRTALREFSAMRQFTKSDAELVLVAMKTGLVAASSFRADAEYQRRRFYLAARLIAGHIPEVPPAVLDDAIDVVVRRVRGSERDEKLCAVARALRCIDASTDVESFRTRYARLKV